MHLSIEKGVVDTVYRVVPLGSLVLRNVDHEGLNDAEGRIAKGKRRQVACELWLPPHHMGVAGLEVNRVPAVPLLLFRALVINSCEDKNCSLSRMQMARSWPRRRCEMWRLIRANTRMIQNAGVISPPSKPAQKAPII